MVVIPLCSRKFKKFLTASGPIFVLRSSVVSKITWSVVTALPNFPSRI